MSEETTMIVRKEHWILSTGIVLGVKRRRQLRKILIQ